MMMLLCILYILLCVRLLSANWGTTGRDGGNESEHEEMWKGRGGWHSREEGEESEMLIRVRNRWRRRKRERMEEAENRLRKNK
jgi:hypothetical protein